MPSEYILKACTQLSRKSERIAGQLICLLQVTSGFDELYMLHMIFVQMDKCLV